MSISSASVRIGSTFAHQSRARSLLSSDHPWSDWQRRFLRSIARQARELTEKQAAELDDLEVFSVKVAKAREYPELSTILGRHTMLKARGKRELVGLCPFHLESTPSFEVNDAKGTYHCYGCGAGGDAIRALMHLEGMRFRDAVLTLCGGELPTISDEDRAKRKADDERHLAERIAIARSICERMVGPVGTPAEVYARARGIIAPLPSDVGFVMTPRWRDRNTGEVGPDHPAIAFVARDVCGEVVGVQCVFLADGGRRKYDRVRSDGRKAKAKLSFGVIAGSAIRLDAPVEELVVVEGPEDGLTLMQEHGQAVWVAAGTAMLPKMKFPSQVRSVVVGADNDPAGLAAAEAAERAFIRRGLRVQVIRPHAGAKDFNDQLLGRGTT